MAKLDRNEAARLLRAAIDAALFRVFYLLDDPAELGDLSVEIVPATEPNWDRSFHETYRMLVDPGGILFHNEG